MQRLIAPTDSGHHGRAFRPPTLRQCIRRRLRPAAAGGAVAAALLAAPACFAAPAPGLVNAPWLQRAALGDAALAGIRGGFDVTPKLTIDFAYQQITSINGTVVATVLIPHVHLTLGAQGPELAGTPTVIATTVMAPAATASPAPPAVLKAGTSPPIAASPTGGAVAAASPTPAPMPAPPSASAVTLTNLNQPGTRVATQAITQVTPSAITTLISNTQNNALIQQAGWANIDISGLGGTVARQAGAAMLNQNLVAASRAFR